MHIKKVEIKNVRSIQQLVLDFSSLESAAGWHVLIGDNGVGKSSILQAISTWLIGPLEILRLDPDFEKFIHKGATHFELRLTKKLFAEDVYPGDFDSQAPTEFSETMSISRLGSTGWVRTGDARDNSERSFSCGIGAYRRFQGGDLSLDQHYARNPKIGAHLTIFKEGAALTESVVWLKDIHTRRLQNDGNQAHFEAVYQFILRFMNRPGLLPPGYQMEEVNADGAMFRDQNGVRLHLYDLSEGIRSVLSLTFEILRVMDAHKWDAHPLMLPIKADQEADIVVPTSGVVLIDEIDAHLHPSWQTRIGDWFTQAFPNMQFIVTTHSPLICRAAEKGTIWHLYNEDGETKCKQVVGEEKDKLVYGSILDSVATGLFGDKTVQSDLAIKLLEEFARLETKALFQRLTESDAIRLKELQSKHLA